MAGRLLASWLDSPGDGAVTFWRAGGRGERVPYAELAAQARSLAATLVAGGLRPGGRAGIVFGTEPRFVAAFFGVLLAGAAPVPLPVFTRWNDERAAHLSTLLSISEPDVVLCDAAAVAALEAIATCPVVAWDGCGAAPPADLPGPSGVALVQLTSGSTGTPRAIVVTTDALEANLRAIDGWIGLGASETALSWLPLHHDMGLIGFLVQPCVFQRDVTLMAPQDFMLRPAQWLRALAHGRHAVTGSPTFALEHVVRRVDRRSIDGLDLSALRTLVVGSDPVRASVLHEFSALLAGTGFDPSAVKPAYGLAEATLAVTGVARSGAPRAVTVPVERLVPGGRIDVERVGDGAVVADVVGCGRPLAAGIAVAIRDPATGTAVVDRVVGEVAVRSESLGAGLADADGWLSTGDCGFLVDGELFVLGRLGDGLKVGGRSLNLSVLEDLVARAWGVRRSEVSIVAGAAGSVDQTVTCVTTQRPADVDAGVRTLRACVGPSPVVRVAVAARRDVPRTTSGKLRRAELFARLAGRRITVTTVAEDRP